VRRARFSDIAIICGFYFKKKLIGLQDEATGRPVKITIIPFFRELDYLRGVDPPPHLWWSILGQKFWWVRLKNATLLERFITGG